MTVLPWMLHRRSTHAVPGISRAGSPPSYSDGLDPTKKACLADEAAWVERFDRGGLEEHVAGFQVCMDDVQGMQIAHSSRDVPRAQQKGRLRSTRASF